MGEGIWRVVAVAGIVIVTACGRSDPLSGAPPPPPGAVAPDSGASGPAASGDAGSDDGALDAARAAACSGLVAAAAACYDSFCDPDAGDAGGSAGSGEASAFCACWLAGKDLSTSTCGCIARDLTAVCDRLDLDVLDPTHYDCTRAIQGVADVCNDVRDR
jgi:hypothetical protein